MSMDSFLSDSVEAAERVSDMSAMSRAGVRDAAFAEHLEQCERAQHVAVRAVAELQLACGPWQDGTE